MATSIEDLEERLNNLEDAVTQMAENNVIKTERIDDTSNRVDTLTPYKAVKTAYIGDTEVVFENVPSGNLSIFGLLSRLYRVERDSDRVTITLFEPLEDVTEVTISIQ